MSVKFVFEDGIKLSKYKQKVLVENYNKGLISLPDGAIIKSIQGINANDEQTTVIIIGRL